MKSRLAFRSSDEAASALVLTMVMTGVGLAILAGAMAWSTSSGKLTERSNRYTSAVAAAEAATEKVVSRISRDFLLGGEKLVSDNMSSYRQAAPAATDSAYWADWEFDDAIGHIGQTFVQSGGASNYSVLDSTYAGLRGFTTTYTVLSNARQPAAPEVVVGAVMQQLQLARIPIFQFAMYSSGDMEISCGQPLTITGRVHSNRQLYVEPENILTFQSDVTAVGDILFQRDPLDPRAPPAGSAIYQLPGQPVHVAPMYLPIGVTNTPIAVREIIEPPPPGEDPNSDIGRERYYNLAELVVVVTDTKVNATSGSINGFMTAVPTNEVNLFVSTASSFTDARESKTVLPIDIDIGVLNAWSATNSNLRVVLGNKDVSSVYVLDKRTPSSGTLGAVRVVNGRQLPSRGLTVATGSPPYVQGHYNQPVDANLAT